LFFSIQKFDFFVYSVSGCCYSCVPALSVVAIDFDAEVFWCHLLSLTYLLNQMPALDWGQCNK